MYPTNVLIHNKGNKVKQKSLLWNKQSRPLNSKYAFTLIFIVQDRKLCVQKQPMHMTRVNAKQRRTTIWYNHSLKCQWNYALNLSHLTE